MPIGAGELVILFVIFFVLFGAARLPKLARSVGEARRELAAADGTDADTSPSGR